MDDKVDQNPTTQIDTDGGTVIQGNATAGRDIVGRDKIEHHHHYAASPPPAPPPLAPPRTIFGLYPFNQHFFGRADELAELHRLLQTATPVSICPVITGMGGLGKTQLAAHYARGHVNDYPDGIFWITAANLNEIRPQLADFCVALGLPVADPQRSGDLTEQKITAFKHYLDQHPRTLLIFDNVDEPDHLRTRQLSGHWTALTLGGKVIITTRRRKLAGDRFAELPLQRLLPAPARQILTTARGDLAHDPDLDRLCAEFGYLPLMLNLAAAALKKRGGAIAGYLQRLHTLGAERLHSEVAKVSLDDYHHSLTAVLHEQWAMLRDNNARLLLRVAGQLPEAAVIPTARLGLLAGLADVDEWERPLSDALEELEAASLVERTDAANVRLHPLVRDFADGLTPTSERAAFRTACAQRLGDAYALNESGLRRLGREYAVRGIAALLLDLITALDLAQSLHNPITQSSNTAHNQSTIPNLQYLLRLLRLEANHLHGPPASWQPQRLWQQLLPRSVMSSNSDLSQRLTRLLHPILHWLPHWAHERHYTMLEQTLTGHASLVNGVAVVDSQRIVSASDDRTLKVWNLQTGQLEQTLTGHEARVLGVAVLDSARGTAQRIVSASADQTLKVWNLQTGQLEQTLTGHEATVSSVAVLDSARGTAQRIVSASADQTLKVWNLQTGQVEQTLTGHADRVHSVAVVGAQRIVSASADRTLKVWNLQTGQVEQTLTGHEASVRGVAVVDAQRIVSASSDRTLKVWNLQTGQVEQTLIGHESLVNGVAVVDAQRIVSASEDRTLKVWNLQTGQVEQTLIGHESLVNSVAVVDAQRIVSASDDHTLKVWNLQTGQVEQTLTDHADWVHGVAVVDAQRIVSASSDRTLKVWNLQTGQIEQTLTSHEATVSSVAVVDGQRIVSASSDRTLKVWNLQTGQVEQTLTGHEYSVLGVAVVDAQHIVSASDDRTLKVWNLQTGQGSPEDSSRRVKQTLTGHESLVNSVAVVDAQRIVSASSDQTLKVWNLQTGQVEQTFTGHADWVHGVAVVDTQHIVSASSDRTLKVWNLHTGQVEQTLTGHEYSVLGVAVVDAQRIVSASTDRTLKVWNLHTGQVIASIGLDGSLRCVAVARQGDRTLVVAGDAGGALYCLELVEPQ